MPILLRKFDAPKMGTWAEKLDADASALFRRIAEVDDAAFLFLFGGRIDEEQFRAKLERLVQIEQTAMSVDYDRLAPGTKFAALDVLSGRVNGNAREDAGAAAFLRDLRFWHRHRYRAMGHRPSQLREHEWCPKGQFRKVY